MDEIIKKINILEKSLVTPQGLANPSVLSETVVKIAITLAQLVDPLSEAELQFRQKRAKEYHRLRENMADSPAKEATRHNPELIKEEADIDKVKNFIKRTDQIITTVQSHNRIKSEEARSNL